MIIFILLIYSIVQTITRKLQESKSIQEIVYLKSENDKVISGNVNIDHSLGLDPRVCYEQTYRAVESILLESKWIGKIKKIVDFGCAEMEFFSHLKNIYHLEEILEIDIDEKSLRDNLFKVRPLLSDYISKRITPLTVHVLAGNISDPFIKLIGTDVVIAIEVIEYLYPDTLDALPYNIFNFIKPKMVIFTTPNADFKVHAPFVIRKTFSKNQKFEWTSKQFQSWAKNIAVRFPNYSVKFLTIKDEDKGSQMAVFVNTERINVSEVNNLHVEGFDLESNNSTINKSLLSTSFGICTYCSCTSPFLKFVNLWWCDEVNFATYKLIETIEYPFSLKRNMMARFTCDKAKALGFNQFLLDKKHTFEEADKDKQILDNAHYDIEQCAVFDELQTCVLTEMESDISSPNTTSSTAKNDNVNKSYSEWTTIAESDESDWETDNNTQRSRGSWTDITESLQSEAEESASRIMDCLINNVNNCVDQNLNSSKDDKLSDSGYARSNTNGTISSRSYSDAVDDNSLDGYCSTSNEEYSKNDVSSIKVAKTTGREKNAVQILHNKDKLAPIPKSILPHFEVTTKICKNVSQRDTAGSSLPSTSNSRKKKRSKRFESDDGNSDVSPPKLLEKRVHNDESGVKVLTGYEYEEIPENDNMLVENDTEGNDHLKIQFYNEEPMEETDTENVALLQSEASQESNEDNDMNQESNDCEVQVINAVELASREALFDPNSQVSLLDDFNISNVVYENLDLDGNDESDHNLILHSINIMASNAALALPLSINPFPNWLLQMLIAEEGGADVVAHNEPHFYCQGDGLGVHPSFANEDVEDDSSSDSSIDSTNDEAEAEPSESEVEVGSLPFDSTSETARQDQLRLEIAGTTIERTPLPDISSNNSAGTSESRTESTDEYFDTVEVNETTNNVKPSNKNCKE